MKHQYTISNSTHRIDGLNIFNGKQNHVIFHPSYENTGIFFKVKNEYITASLENAFNHRPLKTLGIASCISLNGEKEKAIKVEHMLSLVYALGIDNLIIELSDGVCPRQDFGSREMLESLTKLKYQLSAKREYLTIKNGLTDKDKEVRTDKLEDKLTINNSSEFIINYHAYYPHKIILDQVYSFTFNETNYVNQLIDAKGVFFLPFGSRKLIDSCLNKLHGVKDSNVLFIGNKEEKQFLNHNYHFGYYQDNDFVRHKLVDVIGTIALMGKYFKETEFNFDKTGHRFDIYALNQLRQRNCFINYSELKSELR